ncbi:MAG TPA: type II toxin-antitoxin system ParD family antitoxin [Pirellulales bacterium]|nr:type II toxin-antitoxin system ParD family antitoxin [Pirellulales bacterium]
MDSAPLQITLPDSIKEFVEAEMAQGGYTSASDYVAQVLAELRKRKAMDRLEALLIEGLNSEPIEATPEFWDELQRRSLERQQSRRP